MDGLMDRLRHYDRPEQLSVVIGEIRFSPISDEAKRMALRQWLGQVGREADDWMMRVVAMAPREA